MKGRRTSLFVVSMLLASTNEANATKLNQPYGKADQERDAESGYPEVDKYGKDIHDWAKDFVDAKTGRTKTPYEVGEEKAAEIQADLEKDYWNKPYFTINPSLVIPDYTGDKYTTTHACFGRPCKKEDSFLQLSEKLQQPYIDDENYLVFPSGHQEPAKESQEERIHRGKDILKQEKANDPDGNLGLSIHMDGEVYNVAQKKREGRIAESNFVGFPYGHAESDRDDDAGYPSSASSKDVHEFAQ